ncbi:MAG: LysR family transcriptional regulator [Acetobacteraceae bacterium]
MIRFSFKQLAYFVAAAEDGSTSRASESLHVSQPAISMAITQLESAFRQKLFVRLHGQGMVLTPFGRRKLTEVRHLLANATAIAAPEGEEGIQGELEVGVFSTLAAAVLPAILSAFRVAYPGINTRVRETPLDHLFRDLDSGTIELALMYDFNLAEDVRRISLAAFYPYVLLPAGHPLAAKATVSLVDVAEEPYVLIDLPYSREYFLSLFRIANVTPTRLIRCASLESVRGMVAHGQGLSTLVTRPAGDISYDGRPLICRPIREMVPPQEVIIAYSPRSPPTRVAKAFISVSQRYFANREQH